MPESERLPEFRFDDRGLITAVIQDAETSEVLMVAWMNEEALARTLKSGTCHFYSRSRKRLWKKGEESGHVQTVVEVRRDCDRDTLLIRVRQTGGACHTGYESCFFERRRPDGSWETSGRKVFDPARVYGKS